MMNATTPAARGPLSRHLRAMAYQNAWANHRLLKACSALHPAEFGAPRIGFFPSIQATLNHNLTVDWFYIDALERELRGQPPHPDIGAFFRAACPFDTCASLAAAQALADRRLIAYADVLDDSGLDAQVSIARPQQMQRDSRSRLLAHLFQHQIHHRGQVHAMLAGSSVAPPQLDEFFCAGEACLRAVEFAELGWTEDQVWG